jgi:hypothetical protein
LPTATVDAIAWDTLAAEPGSFVDGLLADRTTDLLFSVAGAQGPTLLYLLLEHQSTPDAQMPLRMVEYIVRIWSKYTREHAGPRVPAVVPIVLSQAPRGWTAPASVADCLLPHPPGLGDLVLQQSMVVQDLSQWSNEDIRGRVLAAFPQLALWVLRDAKQATQLLAGFADWASAFVAASRAPDGLSALGQLVRYISLVTDELQYARFRAKIREFAPTTEKAIMTIAEELRAEGSKTALQRTLMLQLRLKFGELSEDDLARFGRLDEAALEGCLARVLVADSVAAVFGD